MFTKIGIATAAVLALAFTGPASAAVKKHTHSSHLSQHESGDPGSTFPNPDRDFNGPNVLHGPLYRSAHLKRIKPKTTN